MHRQPAYCEASCSRMGASSFKSKQSQCASLAPQWKGWLQRGQAALLSALMPVFSFT